MSRNKIKSAAMMFFMLLIAYFFGAFSFWRNIWPIDWIRDLKKSLSAQSDQIDRNKKYANPDFYDIHGRLINYPDKRQADCPTQTHRTAVILAIGQSNVGNYGQKKFTTKYPDQVFNYSNGHCYRASSPLLGASGEEGEYLTLLADQLVEQKLYDKVVIISSSIGGSPIARWQKEGDLNEMLMETIKQVKHSYNITEIIWHQGEADFSNVTPARVYVNSFRSLLDSLAESGVNAPVFIAISTRCGPGNERYLHNPGSSGIWHIDNPTAIGQRMLIDNKTIFLGADTDRLLQQADRRNDFCHLSESGQIKTAMAYLEAIRKVRSPN